MFQIKVRVQPPPQLQPSAAVRLTPAHVVVKTRPPRVLDFDIENRPLSYLGSDFTTAEVTAIAWGWLDRPEDVTVRVLGESTLLEILREFVEAYEQADLVIGHYLRGHDLPMVNGALMELELPPLSDKPTLDTKLDLMRTKGLSLSQENLAAMFRLQHQKESMNQIQWRAANRLTKAGIAEVKRRAGGDVRQHMELYARLTEKQYVSAVKMWRSGSARAEQYVP